MGRTTRRSGEAQERTVAAKPDASGALRPLTVAQKLERSAPRLLRPGQTPSMANAVPGHGPAPVRAATPRPPRRRVAPATMTITVCRPQQPVRQRRVRAGRAPRRQTVLACLVQERMGTVRARSSTGADPCASVPLQPPASQSSGRRPRVRAAASVHTLHGGRAARAWHRRWPATRPPCRPQALRLPCGMWLALATLTRSLLSARSAFSAMARLGRSPALWTGRCRVQRRCLARQVWRCVSWHGLSRV